MTKAYLSLGSNMGDKKRYLYDAIKLLDGTNQICLTKLSSLYETNPWGYTNQDLFMNLAVEIETTLSPIELLDVCQSIEQELGRVRLVKWGPRVIDVDILLYGTDVIKEERLKVPHPLMTERDFVMIPLAQIAPNVIVKGRKVGVYLSQFDLNALKVISTVLE